MGSGFLEAHNNEIGTPPHAMLGQEVRDVEFHGPLGNVQRAGNFLVGRIVGNRESPRGARIVLFFFSGRASAYLVCTAELDRRLYVMYI